MDDLTTSPGGFHPASGRDGFHTVRVVQAVVLATAFATGGSPGGLRPTLPWHCLCHGEARSWQMPVAAAEA